MPKTNVQTREQYNSLFASTAEAIEHENAALSIGRDLLPAPALLVLEGATPTPDYWNWLASQVNAR